MKELKDTNRRAFGARLRLDVKLLILMAVMLATISAFIYNWSIDTHRNQMESELVGQAQGFAAQMAAVWEFVDVNQDLINYTSSGIFEFKKLHCSVAAKAVGELFTEQSDYTIRYTRVNPRNENDNPDAWELGALETFASNERATQYFQLTDYEGQISLRYAEPLYVNEGCLDCHGSPAGELDITGYPKEGMQAGDLAGVISIVIPADSYIQSYYRGIRQDMLFYLALIVAALTIFFFAVRHMVVKPIKRINSGLERVGQGELSVALSPMESSSEMAKLALSFNTMTSELSDLYENLENKVAERTESLNRLNQELVRQQEAVERVNKQLSEETAYKSEFLNIMSHELRTPLTAIVTYLESLADPGGGMTDDERDVVKKCQANSFTLMHMINNILEVGRSEDNRLSMSWELVDLFDVAEMACAEVAPLAWQKGIRVVKDVDAGTPIIRGDWDKLHHVMLNLLTNAIKYSDAKPGQEAEVTLVVRPCAREGFAAEFAVVDEGIGIDEQSQEEIFDRFVQARSNGKRMTNGSGLGLYIVKEFTLMHGGEVHVESVLGKGSTFTVELPANRDKRGQQ